MITWKYRLVYKRYRHRSVIVVTLILPDEPKLPLSSTLLFLLHMLSFFYPLLLCLCRLCIERYAGSPSTILHKDGKSLGCQWQGRKRAQVRRSTSQVRPDWNNAQKINQYFPKLTSLYASSSQFSWEIFCILNYKQRQLSFRLCKI